MKRKGNQMKYFCTSIGITLAVAGTSFAATINVPADFATIQGAIDASLSGDTIAIAAGTYSKSASESASVPSGLGMNRTAQRFRSASVSVDSASRNTHPWTN